MFPLKINVTLKDKFVFNFDCNNYFNFKQLYQTRFDENYHELYKMVQLL